MNLRKILASFAITGVIVGSATQVVACKEPVSKKIINKIKHKDISVPYNATLKQTTSNINQINTALQEANPGLTLSDLSHLTYADVTLKIDTPVSVKVTATVDDHSYSTTLEITMLNPDETTIAKIKSRYVKIAYNSSLKASDSINTNNIRTQLQQANSSLTNDDLKELSFAGTLKVGSPETVQVTATYGSEKAKTTVTVTMMNAANSIINKIMVPNIAIAYNASTDPTKGDNLINIKKALKNANGSLTSDDLGALTFSGTLSPGKPVKIGVTATVKNVKSDPLTLRVTMHNTAQMIIKKITDAGNSYSNTANQNGLTLKENTPEIYRVLVSKAKLTQDDLDHITLSGLKGDFTPGKQQAITVTANVGSGFSAELTATINYTVDDAATLTKAIESLGTVSVAVPNTNASKDDVGMIKKALMKQGLTATQVSKIASFSGTFAASTPATANITATLGDGLKGTAKFKATYETPTAITGMIKTAKFDNFVASSFDTSTPATSKLLLNAVQEANSGSGLTYGALKTMTVEKATLQADKSVEVTITSQVTGDKTQATKVVKVTATSAKELAGVLQLISKSPQAINFSKLT